MVTIVPEAGRFAEVFQTLAGLSADPRREIKSTMDTGVMGLVVPDDLYERYLAVTGQDGDSPAKRRKTRKAPTSEEGEPS